MQTHASVSESSSVIPAKCHIVLVEDDLDLHALVKFHLESDPNVQVTSLFSGENAQKQIESLSPDLVILDVMLPSRFGTDVLRDLRSQTSTSEVPVILLTARGKEEDKIKGFELGADDYVTKPFSPKELVLRSHALLRRNQGKKTSSLVQERKRIDYGPLTLIPTEHQVLVNGLPAQFTATEFKFLLYLAERPGKLVSRELLLREVWEYMGEPNTRTVDTHVKRVRQKLGLASKFIETVHGVGYRLSKLDS